MATSTTNSHWYQRSYRYQQQQQYSGIPVTGITIVNHQGMQYRIINNNVTNTILVQQYNKWYQNNINTSQSIRIINYNVTNNQFFIKTIRITEQSNNNNIRIQ